MQLPCARPRLRIVGKPRAQQTHHLLRNPDQFRHRPVEEFQQGHDGRGPSVGPPRRPAVEQGVQRRAQSIDIAAGTRCEPAEHLGRGVRRGERIDADGARATVGGSAGRVLTPRPFQHSQPEVGEHRLTEVVDQQVSRLHIPVHDADGVRVSQRISDLDADVAHLLERQRSGSEPVGVRTGTQLHDQIRMPVAGDPGVEEIDDVRVAGHPPCGPGLLHETPPVLGRRQRTIDHLDGDRPPDELLDGAEDRGVAARGQYRQTGQAGHAQVARGHAMTVRHLADENCRAQVSTARIQPAAPSPGPAVSRDC